MRRRKPDNTSRGVPAGFFTVALTTLLFVSGCGLSRPNWFQPGHLYHQRLRATHFDPYADTDAAPEFDGGRPRDYQTPRSQPEKAQWFMDIPQQ
jgi:hypothetical protein